MAREKGPCYGQDVLVLERNIHDGQSEPKRRGIDDRWSSEERMWTLKAAEGGKKSRRSATGLPGAGKEINKKGQWHKTKKGPTARPFTPRKGQYRKRGGGYQDKKR